MGKSLGNLMKLCSKERWNYSSGYYERSLYKGNKSLGNATSVHPKSAQSDEQIKCLACSQLLKNWNSWRAMNRKVVLEGLDLLMWENWDTLVFMLFMTALKLLNFMFTFYCSKASLWVDYMTWNRVYSIELSMLAIILLFYKGSLKLVWYACHYSIYAEFFRLIKWRKY